MLRRDWRVQHQRTAVRVLLPLTYAVPHSLFPARQVADLTTHLSQRFRGVFCEVPATEPQRGPNRHDPRLPWPLGTRDAFDRLRWQEAFDRKQMLKSAKGSPAGSIPATALRADFSRKKLPRPANTIIVQESAVTAVAVAIRNPAIVASDSSPTKSPGKISSASITLITKAFALI